MRKSKKLQPRKILLNPVDRDMHRRPWETNAELERRYQTYRDALVLWVGRRMQKLITQRRGGAVQEMQQRARYDLQVIDFAHDTARANKAFPEAGIINA